MFNLFRHKNNNTVCKEYQKGSCSPVYECNATITNQQAKIIDTQDKQIRNLEKIAKIDKSVKWYM